MKFNYQARTKEGEIRTGQIEAFSKEAAVAILQKHGLYPTFIEEAKVPFYAREIPFLKKISEKDLIFATRELATMFRAGVPFVEAINTVAKESQNSRMKEILFEIAREVKAGSPLSTALSRYPEVFSPFYISMIKVGEISGELPQILEKIADYLERNYHFASRVRGAFLYPAMVIFVAILVIFLIFFFVLPKLNEFLVASEGKVPIAAQIFFSVSNFLKNWGGILFLILSGIIFAFIFYFETETGKEELKKLSLTLPFVGPFLKTLYLSRFGQALATLISAGVPITQALEVASELIGENIYRDVAVAIKEEIQGGESLSGALKKYPHLFPPFFSEMISVGEKTGTISKVLVNISSFYEKELERKIENISTVLGPILIIFVGVVVGILMVTILNTIYQTISTWISA